MNRAGRIVSGPFSYRHADYPANEEVSRRKRKQRAIGPDVTVVMLGATVRLLQLLF